MQKESVGVEVSGQQTGRVILKKNESGIQVHGSRGTAYLLYQYRRLQAEALGKEKI